MICIRDFIFSIFRHRNDSRTSFCTILLQFIQIVHNNLVNFIFRSHQLQKTIHLRLNFSHLFDVCIVSICCKCRQTHTCNASSLVRIHSFIGIAIFSYQSINQLILRSSPNDLYGLFQIPSFCQLNQNSQNISSCTQTSIFLIVKTTEIFPSRINPSQKKICHTIEFDIQAILNYTETNSHVFLKTSFLKENIANGYRISCFIHNQFAIDKHSVFSRFLISCCCRTITKIFNRDQSILSQCSDFLFHIGKRSLPGKRPNSQNPVVFGFFNIDSSAESHNTSTCGTDLLKFTIVYNVAPIRNIRDDANVFCIWILNELLCNFDDIRNVIRRNHHIVSISNGCSSID